MKTVTDAEFRAGLGEMLKYLRSGGTIRITSKDQEDVVLTASDLNPKHIDLRERLNKLKGTLNMPDETPLLKVVRDLEKRLPAVFKRSSEQMSFEQALERTRKKHAEIIKRLEDN